MPEQFNVARRRQDILQAASEMGCCKELRHFAVTLAEAAYQGQTARCWVNTHVVGRVEPESLLISSCTEQTADLEDKPEGNHVAQHPYCTAGKSAQPRFYMDQSFALPHTHVLSVTI